MGGGLTMVTYIVKKIKEIRDNQGLESAQTIYRQLYILKNNYAAIKEYVDEELILAGYGDCIVTA
jgi:hypothetical protein